MMRFSLVVALVTTAYASRAFAQQAPSRDYLEGDVSFASASGNSSFSTFSIRDRGIHTAGPWMLTQTASYVDSKVRDRATASELRVSFRVDHFTRQNVGWFVGVADERNTAAGFRTRGDEYAGAVWRLVHSRNDSLGFDLGVQVTEERDVGHSNGSYESGRTAAAYKHVFKNSSYFRETAEYIPSLNNRWGNRANSEAELLAPLTEHLGVIFDYIVRFESKPPVGYGTMDRTMTMGLQFRY